METKVENVQERAFARLRDWIEPAHPAAVKLHGDLVLIYQMIRDKYQSQIDQAFDAVSRQIGFVVTTTLPLVIEAKDGGVVASIQMGLPSLKETLFDRAITGVFKDLKKLPVGAGSYRLYVLWRDALKLKLRTDWMEPAHLRVQLAGRLTSHPHARQVSPASGRPWEEPAHWFDPGVPVSIEDALAISVIDEVYPELRLTDRIAATRSFVPGVHEPAHFLAPGVREPAHFLPGRDRAAEILAKIQGLLREL